MELGNIFDTALKREGTWLPLGPAPEWALAANLMEMRIEELEDDRAAGILRSHKEAIEKRLQTGAKVRVRFLPFETLMKIRNHPERTRKVSLALASVTGWEGVKSRGEPVEFNARNLELVAVSNDSFMDFAGRVCRNLALLTAWRDREVKKN